MAFGNPILGGGGALIRQSIRSPNYNPGVAGWTINKDGSAEFEDVDVRGTFTGTNYVANTAGIFLYAGMPALGNMTGSWASVAGTDAFGNAYPAGFTTYDHGFADFAALEFGSAVFGRLAAGVADIPNAGSISANFGGTPQLLVISPQSASTSPAQITMVAGAFGTATGAPGVPHLDLTGAPGQVADVRTTGSLVKIDPSSGGLMSPYTWQPWAPNTGWANGDSVGSFQPIQYRLDAQDNLIVCGVIHTTAAMTAGAHQISAAPLPAAYRLKTGAAVPKLPGGEHTDSAGTWKAQVLVSMTSTGNVNIMSSSAIATGDNVYVYAVIPLGNVP